ncbi:replication initiation protein [Streptococcus phage Javan623]|uniref:DnaD domain-containing protein n=1 Tax=Streptococcus uberis TaxID=1349 RepID=UPI0006221507|nr:DnaD domain protein [Streptococcus uberis]KKF55651.1 DNA replication protein [Streptococcus uberis B190]QBX21961.1 replication initiation protein [Streptococcus phage Javan623]
MAQRRMFSKRITDTDKFLDMSLSTQALYFHLNMAADDDGFIDRPKTIQRTIGASDDDFKILVAKQFIVPFDSGVVVIKDWYIHNFIRKDTYQPTLYQEEKRMIEEYMPKQNYNKKNRNKYVDGTLTERQQLVDSGKDRIGKDRIGKDSVEEKNGDSSSASNELSLRYFYEKYEEVVGRFLNPFEIEDIEILHKQDNFTIPVMIEALREMAVTTPSPNIKYMTSILKRYKREGLLTVDLINNSKQQREKQSQNISSNIPEWSNPNYVENTTPEEQAKLDKAKAEMLERLNNIRKDE